MTVELWTWKKSYSWRAYLYYDTVSYNSHVFPNIFKAGIWEHSLIAFPFYQFKFRMNDLEKQNATV